MYLDSWMQWLFIKYRLVAYRIVFDASACEMKLAMFFLFAHNFVAGTWAFTDEGRLDKLHVLLRN